MYDNLSTHTAGAFYAAFEPGRARRLARRIKFHHTPKHGGRLNIAEDGLSSLKRRCMAGRRFGGFGVLRREASAWSTDVEARRRRGRWHMKIDDPRVKPKSIYPKNQNVTEHEGLFRIHRG